MNQTFKSLAIASLVVVFGGNALAGDHHHPRPSHDDYRNYDRHRHHSGNSDWVAPLVLFGVAAAAMSAANERPEPPPAPTYYYESPPAVYVERPAAPVPTTSYFCHSSGQYYPYARYCPEGWQAITELR